jgi:hypothetical protein
MIESWFRNGTSFFFERFTEKSRFIRLTKPNVRAKEFFLENYPMRPASI